MVRAPENVEILVQVEDLDLSADWIRGMLGRLGFALRELTAHGVMELLVTASNPRPVVKALLRMVGQAVAHMMPSLRFALAVPSHDGGRWVSGAKLHEADADGSRELVIMDGMGGLEARLAGAGAEDVPVGRSRMPRAKVQQRFELWLSPAGQTEFHHVTVLCRLSERLDLQLASAVAGRLADTVVGLLGMRVFLDDQQVCLCLRVLVCVAVSVSVSVFVFLWVTMSKFVTVCVCLGVCHGDCLCLCFCHGVCVCVCVSVSVLCIYECVCFCE